MNITKINLSLFSAYYTFFAAAKTSRYVILKACVQKTPYVPKHLR